jgi:PHP family Zn ribbon phosphoesterase
MTQTTLDKQFKAMVNYARPMVRKGDDWQAVQWELLNHFDFLTNSDEHEEWTRDAIRECEQEIEDAAFAAECEAL